VKQSKFWLYGVEGFRVVEGPWEPPPTLLMFREAAFASFEGVVCGDVVSEDVGELKGLEVLALVAVSSMFLGVCTKAMLRVL
jgi:hypothetical protein